MGCVSILCRHLPKGKEVKVILLDGNASHECSLWRLYVAGITRTCNQWSVSWKIPAKNASHNINAVTYDTSGKTGSSTVTVTAR